MTPAAHRSPLLLALALALAACSDATGTGSAADGAVVRGVAVVSPGGECLTLELKGQRYEPERLPAEYAQPGLRLRVTGIVHRRNSTCQSGPGLILTKVERE
jgi:hypothetical protein